MSELMRATPPHADVPGDNASPIQVRDGFTARERIMARDGALIGFTATRCVWRFGFMRGSEAANAYGVAINDGEGFLWILATRKTGKVRATFRGYALELPAEFRNVIDGPRTRP